MSEDQIVAIVLNNDKNFQPYMNLLRGNSFPIFMSGQSVKGQVKIILSQGEKLKHRGIFIKIMGLYKMNDSIIKEVLIEQQQISSPGVISSLSSFDFEFQHIQIPFPSYHGFQYSLIYEISATVKKIFTEYSAQHQIIFLQPFTVPISQIQPISIEYRTNTTYFEFFSDSNIISTDGMIKGEIRIKDNKCSNIDLVYIQIVACEILRLGSEPKIIEHPLLHYQLIDGMPKAGQNVPFIIQLSPLKLWTTRSIRGIRIDVSFRLEIYALAGSTKISIGKSPIYFYLRPISSN